MEAVQKKIVNMWICVTLETMRTTNNFEFDQFSVSVLFLCLMIAYEMYIQLPKTIMCTVYI